VEVRFFVNKDQDHNNTSRLVGAATLSGTLIPKRERSDSGIAVMTPSRRGAAEWWDFECVSFREFGKGGKECGFDILGGMRGLLNMVKSDTFEGRRYGN